jgi:hypothetical protein
VTCNGHHDCQHRIKLFENERGIPIPVNVAIHLHPVRNHLVRVVTEDLEASIGWDLGGLNWRQIDPFDDRSWMLICDFNHPNASPSSEIKDPLWVYDRRKTKLAFERQGPEVVS